MAAKTSLMALWKRGWHEIPEVMASSGLALVGLGIVVYTNKLYYEHDGDFRKYKEEYIVYRHDDPRVARIKAYDLNCTSR